MRKYEVLWIDDEWRKQMAFITEAECEGIYITGFRVGQQGREALKREPYKWDAVILDAKCFDLSEDELPDIDGLYKTQEAIIESRTKIPWFVLTGQPDILDDKTFRKSLKGKTIYNKSIEDDKQKLFKDIIIEADSRLITDIKNKYQDVLGICRTKIKDDKENRDSEKRIIELILLVYNDASDKDYILNSVRKAIEVIFSYCKSKGLIKKGITGINPQKNALKNNSQVPKYIKNILESCVLFSQTGSHQNEFTKLIANGRANYITRAVVYELLTIIIWVDQIE